MAALKSLVPADWLTKRERVSIRASSGNVAFHGTVMHTDVIVTLLQSQAERNRHSYGKSSELNQRKVRRLNKKSALSEVQISARLEVKMVVKIQKQGFIHFILGLTLDEHNKSGMKLICRCSCPVRPNMDGFQF